MGAKLPRFIAAPFKPLYESPKRYFLLTGGRGSLKSTNVHTFVAALLMQDGHGILFTRYTMTSAEKSIIPEFKAVAERIGLAHNFHFTKNIIRNKRNGSFVYFSGIKTSSGDQTANLKSISGITTWIIEEGEDFQDEKAFEAIDDSIRTTTHQNRVIWIQNPTTREHFIYKKFIEPNSKQILCDGYSVTVSNLPHVEHIHTTYRIAERFLSDDWLEKANRHRIKAEQQHELYVRTGGEQGQDKHRSHYYHNYVGGWLEKAEGVIFEQWTEQPFDYSLPYAYGLDFGYSPDPTALIAVAVNDKRKEIYLKELFYRTEMDTQRIKTDVVGVLRRPNDLVVADNAEKRTIADLAKRDQLGKVNIIPCVKGPDSVRNGLRKMLGYTIYVDPESKNLKTELNNYAWNDKKSDTPIDEFNHLIDAARYAFGRLVLKSKGIGAR